MLTGAKVVRSSSSKRADDRVFSGTSFRVGSDQVVIARSYLPKRIRESHRYLEGGTKKGNVVMTV
jgi:hypothetical protein